MLQSTGIHIADSPLQSTGIYIVDSPLQSIGIYIVDSHLGGTYFYTIYSAAVGAESLVVVFFFNQGQVRAGL